MSGFVKPVFMADDIFNMVNQGLKQHLDLIDNELICPDLYLTRQSPVPNLFFLSQSSKMTDFVSLGF